jgi:vacuolar-type H+-ATPase subunit F/Vma7
MHFLKHRVSSKEKNLDIVVVTEQDAEKEDSDLRRRTSKEDVSKEKSYLI